MNKLYATLWGIAMLAVLAAVGAFVWPMLAAIAVQGGLAPVIIMIVACFAIAGVLIFLLLYSSRKGYDEGAVIQPEASDRRSKAE